MQLEPPILDPTANPAAAISEVLYGNVYEGLVQFAADGSVQPMLALSWEVAGDGLTYVFHLKSGARFHDGTAFDASAAKFSLDRIWAPASINPQRARLRAISSVEVVDPLTVKLLLNRRSGGLLQSAGIWVSGIMVSPASADWAMRCIRSARVHSASCAGGAEIPSHSNAIRIIGVRPRR